MFNPAKDLQPERPEKNIETANMSQINTPPRNKEPLSPSQTGRFLGALEKTKDEKKLILKNANETQDRLEGLEDDESDSSISQGLFDLIKTKNTKKTATFENSASFDDVTVDEKRLSKHKGNIIADMENEDDPCIGDEDQSYNLSLQPNTTAYIKATPTASASEIAGGNCNQISSTSDKRINQFQNSNYPLVDFESESVSPYKTILNDKTFPNPQSLQLKSSQEESGSLSNISRTSITSEADQVGNKTESTLDIDQAASLKENHSFILPISNTTSQDSVQVQTENTTTKAQELVALIEQIASAIRTIETKDIKSTEIKLQNPPIFQGATLTVTSYSSATHEYNITFSDLSPDAYRLLELKNNEESLRSSLLEKGYTLRQFTVEATNFTSMPNNETGSKESTFSRQQRQNNGSNSKNKHQR